MPLRHTIPILFAYGLNFFQQLLFVQAQIFASLHQRFAVDDGCEQLGASCHTRGCRGTRKSADNLQHLPLKQSLAVVEA